MLIDLFTSLCFWSTIAHFLRLKSTQVLSDTKDKLFKMTHKQNKPPQRTNCSNATLLKRKIMRKVEITPSKIFVWWALPFETAKTTVSRDPQMQPRSEAQCWTWYCQCIHTLAVVQFSCYLRYVGVIRLLFSEMGHLYLIDWCAVKWGSKNKQHKHMFRLDCIFKILLKTPHSVLNSTCIHSGKESTTNR